MKNQKGFTLVEMAIVLVIIGLLLGGVLKGQELIENSKIKNLMNDIKGTQASFNGYMDRFRAVPGDDNAGAANITDRGTNWTGVTEGNANGILTVTAAETFTGAGENDKFWQQVRAAGFIGGNVALASAAALPINAYGGLIGVSGFTDAVTMGLPQNGKYVCVGSVPGKAARAIDISMDDGVPNLGSMRATEGAANTTPGTAAGTYVDQSFYTICTAM